jgi:ribosomal protein S3
MGQKTNPISLRLNINRNFDSCWFHDKPFEYSKLLQQDLKIREYVKSLFDFVGVHTGRMSIQIFPKKLILHYFFHDTDRKSRKSSNKKYKISSRNLTSSVGPYGHEDGALIANGVDQNTGSFLGGSLPSCFEMNFDQAAILSFMRKNLQSKSEGQSIGVQSLKELKKRFFLRLLLTRFYSSQNKSIYQVQNFLKFSYSSVLQSDISEGAINIRRLPNSQIPIYNRSLETTDAINQGVPSIMLNRSLLSEDYKLKRKYLSSDIHLKHIESVLTKNFQSNTLFIPNKISSRYKSAQFICLYICQRIQQNIPFRQIYKQLLLDIKKDESIQGMRIVCSGRLGGVEMARVESKKYGQTSLHVFSSKIDFAADQAYTLFGLIGVKVWISFREE